MKERYYCKKCHHTFNTQNALRLHNKSKHRSKILLRRLTAVLIIAAGLSLVAIYGASIPISDQGSVTLTPFAVGSVHNHSTLRILIDDEEFDLNQENFYERSPAVHMHEPGAEGPGSSTAPNLVHVHAQQVTPGYFLGTIGLSLTEDCLTLNTGQSHCVTNGGSLELIVNGVPNDNFRSYLLTQGDEIIVEYRSG